MSTTDRPPLRRVHPAPATATTVADAYTTERSHTDRPWVGVCMIASLDGSATVANTSGGLGNANDRDVLLTLREIADVVLVGAGTAGGEGYGAPRGDLRIGVVTNSGRVDTTTELFRSGAGFVVTSEQARVEGEVEIVRAGESAVDLALALTKLAPIVGAAAYVNVEGGPTLNGSLLEADLVDEIDLTMAPIMVGGLGPRIAAGGLEIERRFDLAHLLVDDDGYTFGRWVRRGR